MSQFGVFQGEHILKYVQYVDSDHVWSVLLAHEVNQLVCVLIFGTFIFINDIYKCGYCI